MGWASYFEDTLKRVQENVRGAEQWLSAASRFTEDHRGAAIKALKDAQAVLAQAWKHLEIATAPELDHALEIGRLRRDNRVLAADLAAAQQQLGKRNEDAEKLREANQQIRMLQKEKRKLEKQVEKLARSDFASAVDAFSSPEMIKKHKPGASHDG